jgi:putative transposase
MIEPEGCLLSVRDQCRLLGVHRACLYTLPQGTCQEDLSVMRLLDEQYTRSPFYGVERMTAWLHRQGLRIGHNRVRRLLRLMGLEAIYAKPHLSRPGGPQHRIYPYLLGGLSITHPNQVWGVDLTYIRLRQGFVYLVAILDWFSRYVLSWALSTALDAGFCVEALRQALRGGKPEIFNSDQGSQFTSEAFTKVLRDASVRISMDGRGRAFDNIFVERLWRTVKYEEVYVQDYRLVDEAWQGLARYFGFYNDHRLHQSLGYLTPREVHFGGKLVPCVVVKSVAIRKEAHGWESNNPTVVNKKEKEAKRKKILLLQNTSLN